MAAKIKLEAYELKVRKKGDKQSYQTLNEIITLSLMDEIHNYLMKNIYLFKNNREQESTYNIVKVDREGDDLFCKIKVGKYGESSELVDTTSGSGVFLKERIHSDTIPLFFHLRIKKNSKKGRLLIQKYSNKTALPIIKMLFNRILLEMASDEYVMEISPEYKTNIIEKALTDKEGFITALRFETETGLEALSNKALDGNENEMERVEIVVKTKTRAHFNDQVKKDVLQCLKNRKDLQTLCEYLPSYMKGITVNSVLIDIKSPLLKRKRVPLDTRYILPVSYSLSSRDELLDEQGHPVYSKIQDFSIKCMD